jgi:hypothetical protein
MAYLPKASEMYGGDPAVCDGNPTPDSPMGRVKPGKLAERHDQFVKAMTAATAEAVSGDVIQIPQQSGVPLIKSRRSYTRELNNSVQNGLSKSMADPAQMRLDEFLAGPSSTALAKEFTLTNPIGTGLVPFDLEAPAKLIFPKTTPLRNSTSRVKGEGAARRFKVLSSITGSGNSQPTIQPGFSESTTTAGPGGLAYVRPPYVSYSGFDVVLSNVSWGLSDSVSWQAEFAGQGFDDIRSLSNSALMYSTFLLEERLMLFGRGTTANGYAGALGTPASVTLSAVNASVAPGASSSLTTGTYWVVLAADAGDMLGINGTTLHQGPSTLAASVAVTGGQAISASVGVDVVGALGYNIFVGSVQAGPFYYAGRSGWSQVYVTSQPTSGPSTTSGAADASAISTNFDGLLTNTSASGGYVKRLNAPWSTSSPGSELQTAFASMYESTKADPDRLLVNGFDRLGLSNAILSGPNVNAYRVTIDNSTQSPNVAVGAVVGSVLNEVTGKNVDLQVSPWLPQGNCLIQQQTLPTPMSNISETSVMSLVQDMAVIQWPAVQFTYDASSILLGTMCHYAPSYNAVIAGIQSTAIGQIPPAFGDS